MNVIITLGPSLADPTDAAPINLVEGQQVLQFSGGPWYVRSAIWVLRKYINEILEAYKS